jgi:RNA recognition motif-containing protein
MASIAPNQTVYINNLNEKIKKDALKKSIYSVFSQFGKIVDVVCCRGLKLRGQAWVVFADVGAATNALRQMQGFPFYDKPMRIAFAKSKSDMVAKADGTFKPREKRKREEPVAAPRVAKAITEHAAPPPKVSKPSNAPPSNVLFASNLPEDCSDMMLGILFQQYAGFKEVRMVPGNKGIAFVEFADETNASLALQGLDGFKLTPADALSLVFAKR